MEGLKVGHVTHPDLGTGVSVFLFDKPARGGYVIGGAGPATHELAPLNPETSVANVHALMLSGGSAFGLYAGKGVMQYLAEQNIGLSMPHGGVVPIVPAASIYDLTYKSKEVPTANDAYLAAKSARENNSESGRIGAGTGATVGKIVPDAKRMTGGLGRAEITFESGLQVIAYAVVNAVGDIVDENNHIIAGARFANGNFANCTNFLLSGKAEKLLFQRKNTNTTLVAVFTNARFDKAELTHLAKMALAGMARAINPVFTCYDGDIVFCISLGEKQASLLSVGSIFAHMVRLSILDAVKQTEIVS